MKQWFVIFALASLLPAWHDAAASGPPSREPQWSDAQKGQGGGKFLRFVDADGDGLNDLVSDSDGDGIPNDSGFGHDRFGAIRPAQGDAGIPASGSGANSRKGKGGGR